MAALPARSDGIVHRSARYIAIGSSARSPMRERRGRRGRRDQHVDLAEGRVEVPDDQRADLLRLAVVGVVVAAGQRVGAEDDAPLDLGAEALLAGQRHDLLGVPGAVVADPQAVPHGVEPGQVGRALAGRDQVVGGQRVLEVRAGHLGDLGAERLEQLDRLGEPGQHARLVAVAAQLGDHADPHAAHVRLAGRGHHRRHRRVDRGGVHRVVPGHRLVQQGGVEHGPAERARRVQAGRERHHPVPGRAAVGRLGADDAADRGGLADRAAGVGADGQRRLVGGDRGGGPAGRAAGDLGQVPRVVAGAVGGVLGGGAHGELVHVGLAEDDRAGLLEPLRRWWRRTAGASPPGCASRRWWAGPWWRTRP